MPEPYNAIGVTYLEQAQFTPAVAAFHESIRVAPDWAYPRHNLALTYIEIGDNASAEAVYREAIRRTPQHPYLYYNLGILLQRINRRSDAAEFFRTAIATFEDQAKAYRQREARLSAQNPGAKAEAALDVQEADTAVRNEGEAYNALGALWQAAGNAKKARKSYETALKLNAGLQAAQYNLGVLAFRNRRYLEAIQRFESVLRASPGFPEAQQKLHCARKWQRYTETRESEARRRMRQDLKSCPG